MERATEFALPSVGVIIVVALTEAFFGETIAGLIYLLLWGLILLGFYTSATHWNIPYTASFVIAAGILWTVTPGVISEMTHPVFGVIGSLMGVVFFAGMAALLIKKVGLDEVLTVL